MTLSGTSAFTSWTFASTAQNLPLSLQALGLAVPVHGAPESPLPAPEDWNVFPIWDASTRLWRSTGQENIVGALQLLQLLPAPPKPC